MCVVTTTEPSALTAFLAHNFPQILQEPHATISICSSHHTLPVKDERPSSPLPPPRLSRVVIHTDNPASRPLSPQSRRRLGLHFHDTPSSSGMRSQSCDQSERRRRRARSRWASSMDHRPNSTSTSLMDDSSLGSSSGSRDRAPAFRRNHTYPSTAGEMDDSSRSQFPPNNNNNTTLASASPPRRPQRRRSSTSIDIPADLLATLEAEPSTTSSPTSSPVRTGKVRVPRKLRTITTSAVGNGTDLKATPIDLDSLAFP